MSLNRAMTEAQKQARRADILKVALQRFTEIPYNALSMADTAEEAGVAKGTLYLYFKSKEEMFLSIYTEQLNGWLDEMDRQLESAGGEASIAGFVSLVGATLSERKPLLRLIAILHTVLEQNVDYVAAQGFKGWLRERVLKTGALMERHLPFLKAGQGAQLLMQINALVIGFQHMAEPSEVMRQVLEQEDMALFRVDLEKALLDTLRTLLMGLAYEAKYSHA